MPRNYGWNRDSLDARDYSFRVTKLASRLLPPTKMDLRPIMSPIRDQSDLGCCTGFGITAAMEALALKERRTPVTLSPLFVYYWERFIEKTLSVDSGAQIRDGVKVVKKYGAAHEKTWPYIVSKFRTIPSVKAQKEALEHQALSYYRIDNGSINQIKLALAASLPVVFGFSVYSSMETAKVMKTGIIPLPKPTDDLLGGHCVLACGYDDAKHRITFKNSWGASWGAEGYGYLPYDYITDKQLASDFWCISQVELD